MLKEIFTWSKQERAGVIVLSSILLLFIIGDVFFERIFPGKGGDIHPDTLVHYREVLKDLESDLENNINNIEENESKSKSEEKTFATKKSYFDPNEIDLNKWQELGFSEKQALSIMRYKKQIGGFKTKEQVASSYVISEEKYEALKPFIRIKKIDTNELNTRLNYVENEKIEKTEAIAEKIFLDLNSADSIDLLKLKGIGPFYASKIIEYREELGAYVNVDQLLEIWKFDSTKLAVIADNIWVDTLLSSKLYINTDSVETLWSHPYLDWNHAKAIISYRQQHGAYLAKNDLLKIVIFNDSLLNKLYPYISLD